MELSNPPSGGLRLHSLAPFHKKPDRVAIRAPLVACECSEGGDMSTESEIRELKRRAEVVKGTILVGKWLLAVGVNRSNSCATRGPVAGGRRIPRIAVRAVDEIERLGKVQEYRRALRQPRHGNRTKRDGAESFRNDEYPCETAPKTAPVGNAGVTGICACGGQMGCI
jgi:hypothetical protein